MQSRFFTVAGASVAASCTGASCAGKSPVSAGCSAGAQTLASMVVLGTPAAKEFLVEHRYSPACLASWTTVTDIRQPDCLYSVSVWHEAIDDSTGGRTRTAAVGSGSACSASTVMMSTVGKANRACAHSTWEGLDHCTAWK